VATQWQHHWNQVGQNPLQTLLLDAVNQAVIATDLEGRIQFWNRAAETLYGWTHSEALGKSVLEVIPALGTEAQAAEIMTHLRQGQSWSGEFQVRDRAGRAFAVSVNNDPIYDSAGHLVGIIGVSTDISESRVTQHRLIHQTQQAQMLAQVVNAIHQSLDLDTIFSVSAAHIAELLQAQVAIVQYLPQRRCWVHRIVFNPHQEPVTQKNDIIPDANNPLAERLKRLEVVQINDTREIVDPVNGKLAESDPGAWLLTPISIGDRVWGSLTLGRLHQYVDWQPDEIKVAQQVAAQLAIAIDKAETYQQLQRELERRRMNENRLRQYEQIVAATLEGMVLLDRYYIYRVVNQVYLDWHQKPRDQIVGHTVAEVVGQEVFQQVVKPQLERCLQGEVVRHSHWFNCGNSPARHLHAIYSPLYDSDGEISGIVATLRDVTDLQRAQETLRRQAKQERMVNNIVNLLRQSFEIESILPLALEDIGVLLEADYGAIARYHEESQSWQPLAAYCRNDHCPPNEELALPPAASPVATHLQQGQVICVDNSATLVDPIHQQLAKLFPGAWLIVPLRITQRTWGSLILCKSQPHWMPEAEQLSRRIADQLAIGIHQAALFQAAQVELQKRQLTEQALREQESFFRSLYEQASLGIAFCQSGGQILQVNAKYCAITGYSEQALKSMSLGQLTHPEDRHLSRHLFLEIARAEGSESSTEQRYVRRDGTIVWVHLTVSIIRDERGNFKVLAAIIRDISDRKQLEVERQQAEAKLRHHALHDTLTQLPNRNLLMTQLERALERMQRPPHQQFAVLFLDLDRFKLINDSLGHLAGDRLLMTMAQTLSNLVRPGDLVARLGGDEFVILLEAIHDTTEVLAVADRLLHTLRQPLPLEQREVFTTASIGIVIGTLDYRNATELLRDADIAMYRAKANGKDSYALFDPALHEQLTERLQIEHDLRRAIARQQLELHYQPIVNLRDGSIYCLEALMRWRHPERGLISPGEFIPVAEETGIIVKLDQWAIQTACQQLKQWQTRYSGAQQLSVSVNLSAQDLHHPGMVESIRSALSESGLTGEYLVLEMTESLLVSDTPQILQLVEEIQELSVKLAVDDFGTGYSSLSYLHRFPLGALKIDQSFTSNMPLGSVNQEIVETIVALSDRLGMIAIAEGGETLDQLQHLQRVGCEYSQGYYFCQPLPGAQLESLLAHPYPFADRLPEA